MCRCVKKITEEQYRRAINNKGRIVYEDMRDIFDVGEICGYGVYLPFVKEENGDFYVSYVLGTTCD